MSITGQRTVRDDAGQGRTQIDICCDGPDCDVTITTDPFGVDDPLLAWPTVELADDDLTTLWFHDGSCLKRWAAADLLKLVDEGWWHPNVNAGRVHLHPERPGRAWQAAMHRQCEPVYTHRSGAPREGETR